MARTAQILVLFLLAACAAQAASSGRRSYSHGRSHSRHHEPRDYRYSSHRSRHGGDYSRRPGSHAKLHGPSAEELDGSTPNAPFEASETLHEPTIHVDGKEGGEHGNTISVDGKLPGNHESPDAGTIKVEGALPEGDSVHKLPSIADNFDKPDAIEHKPNDGGNTINVDGLNPLPNDGGNTINVDGLSPLPNHGGNTINVDGLNPSANHGGNTINVDGLNPSPNHGGNTINVDGLNPSPNHGSNNINVGGLNPSPNHGGNNINIDGLNPSPNNDHLIPVDNLKPGNEHIPDINPGTVNIDEKSPNEGMHKPGDHIGSNKAHGLLPNANDMPNHGNLPNIHEPDNDSSVNVGDHGKINIQGQPSNNKPIKGNENLNLDELAGIKHKEEPNNSHNTIDVGGLLPGNGNKQPSNIIPDNITEKPVHLINPHDSFPEDKENQPKHDHSNVNGLLPGGDGSNSEHGIGFGGGLTTSGKPNHNNVGELKPTGHQPDINHLNNNGIPTGAGDGVHNKLPNQMKPVRPDGSVTGSVSLPDLTGQPAKPVNVKEILGNIGIPGDRDNNAGGNKEDKSFVLPVYLPGANGQVVFPNGVMSQNGKVPAFYIVMNNGKPTLVRNPAAGLSGIDDGIDINSILGQVGGLGGITIGGLSNFNGLAGISGAGLGLLQQPFLIGSNLPNINIGNTLPGGSVILGGLMPNGNVPSFISGEPSVNIEPGIVSEQIQPPVITETVPVPQPIYPMPVNPGSFVYPNMPYPYPYPSMWDNNMNPNMNWPNIIDFFINLGAHINNNNNSHPEGEGQHKPDSHHGGSGEGNKPINGKGNGGSSKTVRPNHKPDDVPISGEKIEDESNKGASGSGTDQPIPNRRPNDTKKPNNSGSDNSHREQPDHPHITTFSTENPIFKFTTTEPVTRPSELPVTKHTESPIEHESRLPDHTNNPITPAVTEPIFTKATPKPSIATRYTPLPDYTKPTVIVTTAQTPVTEGHLHDEHTESPNHNGNSGNDGSDGTPINEEKDIVPTNPAGKPGNDNLHITMPSKPGFSNDETKIMSGPYDPTLINLLNVVLKLPNKASLPKTRPPKDNDSLKKVLAEILKQHPGDKNINNFVSNPQPNIDDKTLKELLELLKSKPGDKDIKDLFELLKQNPGNKDIKNLLELIKSKPGDKAIKDLLEILKSKPGDKALKELLAILKSHGGDKKPSFHEILALLGRNEDKNLPNPAILYQLILHLLDEYNRQPNTILVEQPGMDEATRSNLILLLNLLASNLGREYSSGLGYGGGYYEQVNPSNLYFLGHFPCDFSTISAAAGGQGFDRGLSSIINAGAGGQGFERGLWQLISQMFGLRSSVNPLRLERSAEEDDAKHHSAKK